MTHTCARTQVNRPRRELWQRPTIAPPAPSHEEISHLAYSYWEEGGRQHGSQQEDWFRAERELLRRRPSSEVSYLL
jgi:Protein of unknown function (DUF2934)